ncbi:VOC family protein [Herbidospora mongoliensis]|uniref:VOC family protein n=1 Tax=Herbidospora mongoliensis TaxID=688067 RepID=UPI000B1AF443|nr:VOC family protein [Herbidospora mongoliensis]
MTTENESLAGLRVLVTGGSRGLGAATARRFAAAGATVLTASRTAPTEVLPAVFIPAGLRPDARTAASSPLSEPPHTEGALMNFSLTSLIVDAADLESESSFWHGLLGGSITKTATHHFLRIDGFPVIVIQHAPGHAPGASQQMHFDLATDDVDTAHQRVLTAGGRRLRPTGDAAGVYASPAGHPFCIRPA